MQTNKRFFHVFYDFIRNNMSDMSNSSLRVYLAIKAHVDYATGEAFPSRSVLSDITGLSTKTVSREVKKLVDAGFLRMRRVGRKNVYKVTEKFIAQENQTNKAVGGCSMSIDLEYIPKMMKDALEALEAHKGSGHTFHFQTLINIEKIENNITNVDNHNIGNDAIEIMEAQRKNTAADAIEKARADIKLVK